MNASEQTLSRPCPSTLRRMPRATRLALEVLDRVQGGAIGLDLPDGQSIRVGRGPLQAHWRVHDLQMFDAVLASGDIGLAEAWMDGCWDTDDLTALLTLLSRNRAELGKAVYGRFVRVLGHRIWHMLRANTRSGARRNIEAHYDLGNEFYQLWLDQSMTYSAALFDDTTGDSLNEAQLRKYRRILDVLAPASGDTILEIGCGWGGFAEVAVVEYGCRVLGVTLSPSQLEFARQRAVSGGYADRVNFELCDYRDVRGHYDHIVSIEMIEAVGERFWPTYFGQLANLLKPGGRCVVQAITIADPLFNRYRRGTDFIQRHVFPGGMLPSPAVVATQAAQAGLTISDDFGFGKDYGRTLACWHERFVAALPAVRAQGFSERFIRMWRFYLAYCEAGFITGDIDVRHYRFEHRHP